jgi:hypothetical protein
MLRKKGKLDAYRHQRREKNSIVSECFTNGLAMMTMTNPSSRNDWSIFAS